ncbi:MAG TPA: enoyl-CoA hydratase-related protein [Terriglobales bacterium]|nr:enoyl-CoA hydratase-related protein [Terriglobales bacterium]
MTISDPAAPVRVVEETPAYWRVVFDYPPFNIVDATIFEGLQNLLVQMDTSPGVRVVVFESASADFYLAHFDLTGKTGNITTAVGASGLPILMDTFVRLTKSPVVSIAKIRGCVRGVSSEFVLACDMRFASRENTRLGQPEVGVGVHPGGGGTERLPHLVGRGRALEIVLGANDFDGDTAERYGYVNRALPDAELDGFVDALARRIASFDRRAIAAAKNLINQVSLPSSDRLLDAITSFETALSWPEAQQRFQALVERGLQREVDFEKRWPDVLGTLVGSSLKRVKTGMKSPEENKALVLEAFDTLFNKRDYAKAAEFWSENYIQHSAHLKPGRDGLFNLVRSQPDTLRYENALITASGDYVMLHGRFNGRSQGRALIAADIVRLEDGRLAEHWDVLQDEATQEESKSGLPMFGTTFPEPDHEPRS